MVEVHYVGRVSHAAIGAGLPLEFINVFLPGFTPLSIAL